MDGGSGGPAAGSYGLLRDERSYDWSTGGYLNSKGEEVGVEDAMNFYGATTLRGNFANYDFRTILYSDSRGGYGYYSKRVQNIGGGGLMTLMADGFTNTEMDAERVAVKWNVLSEGHAGDKAAMAEINEMREGGEWIEHAKFIGEMTHNTVVMAIGQGFEAAKRAAPGVKLFGTGYRCLKIAGHTIVVLDGALTIADGLKNGFELMHGMDLYTDGVIITTSLPYQLQVK